MMRALKLVLKLGRLKMTVFSAVTYGTAASVANLVLVEAGAASEFDAGLFLAGWSFVFFTQLVAHFLGEDTRTLFFCTTEECMRFLDGCLENTCAVRR